MLLLIAALHASHTSTCAVMLCCDGHASDKTHERHVNSCINARVEERPHALSCTDTCARKAAAGASTSQRQQYVKQALFKVSTAKNAVQHDSALGTTKCYGVPSTGQPDGKRSGMMNLQWVHSGLQWLK